MLKIIQSFLKARTFRVMVDKHLSIRREIAAGVPQGSVLEPILYSPFTYDIPRQGTTKLALFADDMVVIAQCRNPNLAVRRLQESLDILSEWFERRKIAINEDKTEAVIYTKRLRIHPDRIMLNDTQIKWSSEAKYLGLTLDSRLTWKTHTDKLKQKGFGAIQVLRPLLNNPHLNLRTKLLIYKSVIRPAITYGAAAWSSAAKTHLNKIQVLQNKALRLILSVPWYVTNIQIYRDLNISSIRQFMRDAAISTINIALQRQPAS